MTDKYIQVAIGAYSVQGLKSRNEDAVNFELPEDEHKLINKGICACIADGVSSAEAGQYASQHATQEFISNYLKTPDTWSANHAGGKVLSTINLNLFKRSHEFIQQEKGYLCTFDGVCTQIKNVALLSCR